MYSYSSSYSTSEKLLPNQHVIRVTHRTQNDNGKQSSFSDAFDINPLGEWIPIPVDQGLLLLEQDKKGIKTRKSKRKSTDFSSRGVKPVQLTKNVTK